jgi:hypothetical protein
LSAFVQERIATVVGPTSTPSLAFTANNGAGHVLVVSVSWDALVATDVTSVSGNANLYVRGFATQTFGTRQMSAWYVLTSASGANTVVFHFPGNVTNATICLSEYSGLGAFDLAAAQTGNLPCFEASSGLFTPAGAGETVVAHAWSIIGFGGAGPGYVARDLTLPAIVEDRLAAPAGAQQAEANQFVQSCCCAPIPTPWILFALVFKQGAAVTQDAIFFNQT